MIVWELRFTSVWHYASLRKKNLNLLFDMCRWQVEDGDVEIVHRAIAIYHLFFYQQAFIKAMSGIVATITQASAYRGQ